jgi:hypothetical protein
MVIVAAPVVAELLAVSVSKLLPVVGLVPKAAVTPLGIPEAVRVTGPVNPPTSVTLMVSVPPAFRDIVSAAADGASVKLPFPAAVTVRVTLVVSVRVPDVPVMGRMYVPTGVVQGTEIVIVLLPLVIGLLLNMAVTPVGNPDIARVTLPVIPFWPDSVMVSLPEPHWGMVRVVGETLSEKPCVDLTTVRAMVVLEVKQPEVPVIVTVAAPTAAVLLAVS